ncbi:receptor-type tyrosine-protein phosphatase alpha-like isoform X2 [Haliotis rufescens]|uniref:receptor-type tyrosine-protein phosphatase alpha-like isoform X2 n=2 Tax=Haliotis rufescens TaxID=6454 RepID=UPI00201EB452|nr:receptor-type tyrosine-protein phosphatase alpha-like isoform X2 [Haliotis rufescens]
MAVFDSAVVFIASLSLVTGSCPDGTYGFRCGYHCNCLAADCDSRDGCRNQTCNRGWSGPTCQKHNKALDKPTKANRAFMPSRNAVDGYTNASNYKKCFHSATTGIKSARWRVDLSEMTQIHDVTIYFRTDNKVRRNGIQIYIAETDASQPAGDNCYNVTGKGDGTDIPDILNVTCSGKGRYLVLYTTVKNNKDPVPMMDFCEVQVYVCGPGTFGSDCANYCHCDGEVCDFVSGVCPSGDCLPGWKQDKCDTECTPGDYGAKCSQKCSNRNCKTDNSRCDHVTGECAGGCLTGWNGTDCTQKCLLTYGDDCANMCSDRQCNETSTCDHVTGKCESGCKPGWKETDCTIECIQGIEYGSGCVGNCSARMCDGGSGSCPNDTGQCNSVCLSGWQGEDCAEVCSPGSFGVNCTRQCGQCRDDNCHHINGTCLTGCSDGWTYNTCTQKQVEASTSNVGVIAGFVVAVIVVAVIVAVVVVLLRRRRSQHSKKTDKHADMFREQTENGAYGRRAGNQKPQIKPKPAIPASSGKQRYSKDKDQEEEDCDEDVQSPDNCYYNAEADAAIRDVAVSELAAMVATLKERKDGFEKEYHRLPAGFTAPYQDSQKPENSGKNKFKGYYPYDHNRVRLTPLPDTPGSDYINASLMHSYNRRKTYIASQAPNKKTVGDFWRMIWEHSCSHVVMLTGLTEESRIKCERYWPTGGVMDIGLFKIEVEVTQSRANFTTRHMKVTSNTTGEFRSVVQFHFTSWPDHGVPDILALVKYVWLVRQTVAETDGPLLVHCSAGIGRTGTYIAVDSLIDQAQGEGVVDVLGYVSVMRGQRKNMIQTPAQYECVFLCLVEMTKYGCTSMDVSNYTNSYSCSDMDTIIDGKTFRQLSEMLVSEAREDAPTRHRMWVDGNPDFIVRVGPSLTCLRGYLQATAPPPGLVKLLWKLVEENDVHNIIVVTPDMGLVQAEGRSKTHGEITVTTTSQTNLSTDLTMSNLTLATKAGRPRQVKIVDVNAHLTMEAMTSHLLNHAQLQKTSTQPHPVVIVHSDNDRKLAVSFCIMGNILSGIREDTRVDVIGHMRTFLRCCPDLQFTQSDVQMFHDFAQQCILRTDPANTYANI